MPFPALVNFRVTAVERSPTEYHHPVVFFLWWISLGGWRSQLSVSHLDSCASLRFVAAVTEAHSRKLSRLSPFRFS